MKHLTPAIVSNHPISTDFFEMTFSWDATPEVPRPGQFFTVRISRDTVPLLRRPFAFSALDPDKKTASMIYQKRGRGTEILTGKRPGDALDLLGPLGTPFPLPDPAPHALLVAGGIGIGPLLFLATAVTSRGGNARMIFGCRSSAMVPDTDGFRALSPVVCTDDGSAGFKGTAAEYLASSYKEPVIAGTTIYACGPLPMLKACHEFARSRACACMVSVEQVMACGVGACMGCAVKMAGGGFKRACIEGPVFDSGEIAW
ncbi:MAG: dihydroorotate dehydrogenase electron transfer subunit [Chitinispirillaceae bacterium]|nr:dihydroorotate dehydrogenase electron transfer subunit [Chitinispirillaceae bacterium]